MSPKPIIRGLAAGFIAGLAASWIMNQFQSTLTKIFEGSEKPHGAQSAQEGSPNHGIAAELKERGLEDESDNAAERSANIVATKVFDYELTEKDKVAAGAVVHYLFGASTGALYGLASELRPEVSVGAGLPFGAAVWLAADEGLVPALGLSKWPTEYSILKQAYALASHLVYGVTTDLIRRATRAVI